MGEYYIYRHIRLDTNTTFYIGKGKKSRAYIKCNRNKHWKNIVSKTDYKIEIIIKNLTEDFAYDLEIKAISLYKSLGYCEANIHPGGFLEDIDQFGINNHMFGRIGNKHPNYKKKIHSAEQRQKWSSIRTGNKLTEEQKQKLSKATKGKNNPFYGKRHSEKSLIKMAHAKLGKPNKSMQKQVIDLSSGFVFESATKAALSFNMKPKTLMNKLAGRRTNNTNLSYIE
jgi:hypothetical protein